MVQHFLGFANFYRKFIRNFSTVAAPLHALTSPHAKFQCSPQAEAAFKRLDRFTSAPVLALPDRHLQCIVEVDASDLGIGAVLSQQSPSDGKHETQMKQPAPRTRPITTPWCQPEQHPVVACHHEFQDSSPGVRCNSFSRPSTSAGGILPSSLSAGPAHGPARSSPFAGPAHGPAGSSPFAGPAQVPAGSSPFAGPAHGPTGSSPFAGPAHGPAGSSPFAGPAHGPAGSSPFAGPAHGPAGSSPFAGQRMVRQAPHRSQVRRTVQQVWRRVMTSPQHVPTASHSRGERWEPQFQSPQGFRSFIRPLQFLHTSEAKSLQVTTST